VVSLTSSSGGYINGRNSANLELLIDKTSSIYNFKIINFPNMCSNIPASPAYGVYISQLIRYARASSNYSDFLKRHLQGYINGRNSANIELLIDKTSSIYLYVKLKALAS
jgi:hypothetical protein